jgi:carbohydrate-selective porin OprB
MMSRWFWAATCGGFIINNYIHAKYQMDHQPNDVLWCTADIGWLTMHIWGIAGALTHGATTIFAEGALDFPEPHRFFCLLNKHRVTKVFTSPSTYGADTFRLVDVAYQQKLLDDRVELRVGRIATGDDFLVFHYNYVFVQNGFDGNPAAIFFNAPGMTPYPHTTWGALVQGRPSERTYVKGGLYNGDTSIRDNKHHGLDWSMDGPLFAIGEAGYKRDDQMLLRFGEPGSNRGLGVTGSALISPDQSVSQMPFFSTAGFLVRGLFPSRPGDGGGFGIVFGQFSNDLQDSQRRAQQTNPTVGVQRYETALEFTYGFRFRGGALFLQPDLQYIIRPGGTGQIPDAFVGGVRAGINF